jgi:glycosyltransferase involved in cell wall biosynthesis
MKILILAGIFPPDIGGPAHYIPKLSAALVKRGHDLTVLCFSDVDHHKPDSSLAYPVHRISRKQNILSRELQTLMAGIRLAASSDLIYSNGNDFKALLIGLATGKPRVHKIVGDVAWERAQNRGWYRGTLDEYQDSPKNYFLRSLDWARAFPLRMASRVIVPSHYLQKIVSGWKVHKTKIKIVYNAFNELPEPTTSLPIPFLNRDGVHVMCTVCRLVAWKGVDTLIRALTWFPNLALIVVGDGPLENELKKLTQDLGVSDRVYFSGRQPREQIKYFLSNSSFFVLNSSYEGLPHVVLEAMSCKTLVVASESGGTPELVHHQKTGLLFKYNDEVSLRSALVLAMVSQQTLIQNAEKLIESQFSFDKMLQETESVFLEATNS